MERAVVANLADQTEAVAQLVKSAQALGVRLSRHEAARWIASMSANSLGGVAADGTPGAYRQRATMADQDPPDLERFRRLDADRAADYVERLTEEIHRYTVKEADYARAARRMYNVFRLTGRYSEAAYIRDLFEEPVAQLYQGATLLAALGEAAAAGDIFETDALVGQIDALIMSAITALDGRAEAEAVSRLLALRDAFSGPKTRTLPDGVPGAGLEALRAVNDYFERVLKAVPSILGYLDSVAATRTASHVR